MRAVVTVAATEAEAAAVNEALEVARQKQMPRQKIWLMQRQRQRQLLPRKLLRLRRPLLKPPPRQRRRPGRLLPLPLPRLPPQPQPRRPRLLLNSAS